MLNVKDFGAKGDQLTDDTIDLQACAAQLQANILRYTPPGGIEEASFPSVLFPSGHYVISQPIDWGPYASLVTDGRVVIRNTSSGDSFRFSGGYIVEVDGFSFLGGGTSIRFQNNNVNGARLNLGECRFQGTSGFAVVATPNTPPYFSSHVNLDHCKWYDCVGALLSWADMTNMTHGWCQWSESVAAFNTTHGCFRIVGGRLSTSDSMYVPVFPSGIANGARWIVWDGYPTRNGASGLFCDKDEFHGEYAGLPIVEIRTPPDVAYPFQGPSAVFRGCQLSCGPAASTESAVITCNGGLFQTVYADACTNLIGPCPFIRDTGNGATVLASLQNASGRVRVVFGANCFYPLNPTVPAFLQPYVRNLSI